MFSKRSSTQIFIGILAVYLAYPHIFVPYARAALVSDGILIQAASDPRVFYLEDGTKRWIESLDAFLTHGFDWKDVQKVSMQELDEYPAGKNVNVDSIIVFPNERERLPDLTPFALYDFRFAEKRGRTILKFSSTYWNKGKAPLKLVGDPQTASIVGTIQRNVFQKIERPDNTQRHKIVGSFEWHAEHSHYHYSDFARYIFEPLDPTLTTPVINEKATRCLWDTEAFDLRLSDAPSNKTFNTCKNKELQGVSVGWGDTYDYTLADQYLDVHDMPAGLYKISLVIDPINKFVEMRKDNNTSVTLISLDVKNKKIEVIAAGAPFLTTRNLFTENMLTRGEGDEKIYVINNNKRRWIRDEQIFNSYGFSWNDIRVFPRNAVDSIPFNNFVTLDGKSIYALNDFGYKRLLKNSDVLTLYNLDSRDIVYINQLELSKYPNSRVLRVAGNENLYLINENLLQPIVSPFLIPQFNPEEVHMINPKEFANYSNVE